MKAAQQLAAFAARVNFHRDNIARDVNTQAKASALLAKHRAAAGFPNMQLGDAISLEAKQLACRELKAEATTNGQSPKP